jgi:hypothetical protein
LNWIIETDFSFRWASRRVLDFSVTPDKWSMLLTMSSASCSVTPMVESTIISLHHAMTMKSLAFQAIGGCFRAPGYVVLLSAVVSDTTTCLSLSMFDLEVLLKYASTHDSPGGTAYRSPVVINGHEDAGLHPLWTVDLGHVAQIRGGIPFVSSMSFFGDRLFVVTAGLELLSLAFPPLPATSPARYLGRSSLSFPDKSSERIVSTQWDTAIRSCPGLVLAIGDQDHEADGLQLIKVNLKNIAFKA